MPPPPHRARADVHALARDLHIHVRFRENQDVAIELPDDRLMRWEPSAVHVPGPNPHLPSATGSTLRAPASGPAGRGRRMRHSGSYAILTVTPARQHPGL